MKTPEQKALEGWTPNEISDTDIHCPECWTTVVKTGSHFVCPKCQGRLYQHVMMIDGDKVMAAQPDIGTDWKLRKSIRAAKKKWRAKQTTVKRLKAEKLLKKKKSKPKSCKKR